MVKTIFYPGSPQYLQRIGLDVGKKGSRKRSPKQVKPANKQITADLLFLLFFFTVTFFVLPVVQLHGISDSALYPRFLVLGIMISILSILLFILKDQLNIAQTKSLLTHKIFPFAFLYVFATLLSGFQAFSMTEWLYVSLKVCLFILYFYFAAVIFLSVGRHLQILLKILIIKVLLISLVGMLQYHQPGLFDYFPLHQSVPRGFMWHRNLFAQYLFLSAPFVYYGTQKLSIEWKIAGWLALAFSIYNIIIATTRSVWLAMAVSAVFLVLVNIWLSKRSGKTAPFSRKTVIRSAIVSGSAAVIIVIAFSFNTVEVRTFAKGKIRDNGRLRWWMQSVRMIKDHPVSGIGAGQWAINLPNYGRARAANNVAVARPHNDILWIFAETGISGITFFLSLFLIGFIYIYRIFKESKDGDDTLIAKMLMVGLLGYFIFSFFSYPRERIEHSIFFMFYLALITAEYHSRFPIEKKVPTVLHTVLLTLGIGVGIFSSVVGYYRIAGERHAVNGLKAQDAENWQLTYREANAALNPFYTVHGSFNPIISLRGYANMQLKRYPEAIEDFKAAQLEHPYSVMVIKALAECYKLQGEYDKSILYYEKALKLDPYSKDLYYLAGESYFRNKEFRKAKEMLSRLDPEGTNPDIQSYLKRLDANIRMTETKPDSITTQIGSDRINVDNNN